MELLDIKWTFGSTTFILLFTILIKYSISLSGYSGSGMKPMFGDFEAQRHWLEITSNLDLSKWYYYDLPYWGLDYPPLTAYHSWVLGHLAKLINKDWVALDSSRGFESDSLKLFMRLTALFTDCLILLPAILYYSHVVASKNRGKYLTIVLVASICPAIAIIDHGHFQYNAAMLGFALLAFSCFLESRFALGSLFFVCSLAFKQMALFYALPVFFHLLGKCRDNHFLLMKLGLSVIFSFAVILLPFFTPDLKIIMQIIHRVFPVARGLYEDKVANFWCAISVLVKIRSIFTLDQLIKLSILTTLVATLPACIYLFMNHKSIRSSTNFMYALSISSLGFFLFSFQVHEKSILLPILPITLLYPELPFLSVWFNNVAMFSMWPLLKKDGLAIPYIALTLLWNTITYKVWTLPSFFKIPVSVSYFLIACLHALEVVLDPPSRLPDIYVVLNVILSTAMFGMMFLYLYYRLFTPLKKVTKVE